MTDHRLDRGRIPAAAAAGPWAWLRARPWRLGLGVGLLLVAVAYPFAGGAIAARIAAGKLQERLGTQVRVGHSRAGLLAVTFRDLDVGPDSAGGFGPRSLAHVDRVRVPFVALLFRRGVIEVDGVTVNARRGGPDDNVTAVLAAIRSRSDHKSSPADKSEGGRKLPGLAIRDARVNVRDAASGFTFEVGKLGALVLPGQSLAVQADKVDGLLALGSKDRGPRFGAQTITVTGPLEGIRPRGYPTLTVTGGFATPLPNLALTGIHGKVHPASGPGQPELALVKQLVVDLDGSYGGSHETLWTARGGLNPSAHEGQLSLRAEHFSLGEIADVLPSTVRSPSETTVDAAFDVSWAEGAVRFGGDMQVAGLNIQHPALASDPVLGINLALVLRGTAFPATRRVAIDRLEGRIRELSGKLSGFVELAPGNFTFADGSRLGFLPRLELTLVVPPLSCAKALASLPPTLVPQLQGFALQGSFGAEITARVDYANLDALELKAKVGIDGCRVLKPPPAVKSLVSGDSIVQSVEVPRPPPGRGGGGAPPGSAASGAGDMEDMEFIVGPENPDFVPYEQISPHLIASIMTTEDNGFFKHRGWVTSEFRAALKRNLQRGGFRGGASSITMQMVKNVLLSHEKTLSRKLQELFLVWYLEHEVPKERILELYFNAIEFGPRIYGIGAAARHYFGKSALELTPLEGAFFSSILPSPKRRYVQYCHGALTPQWDRYVRRILAKVHERGRLDDETFAAAAAEKLVFDRREATFNERQCMDWVKKMTARPEPEVPPDIDAPIAGDADPADAGPIPVGKLRRLFSKDTRRASPPKGTRPSPKP